MTWLAEFFASLAVAAFVRQCVVTPDGAEITAIEIVSGPGPAPHDFHLIVRYERQ